MGRISRHHFALLLALAAAPGTRAETPADAARQADEADRAILREAKVADEPGALLDFYRARVIGEAERAALGRLIDQLGDERFERREEAAERLRRMGMGTVGPLRQAEEGHPDAEAARRAGDCLRRLGGVPGTYVSAAVARRLGRVRPVGAARVLLDYLPSADTLWLADEVRSALAAVAVRDGRPDAELVAALDAPQAARRVTAAEALVRGGAGPLLPRLAQVARAEPDPEGRVRLAAAFVEGAADRSFVPALIDAIADAPEPAMNLSVHLLNALPAEGKPAESLDPSSRESRARCRDAWRAWWDKAGPGVDLAALARVGRLQGINLMTVIDNTSQFGQVVEVGRDGKERVLLRDLMFPIAAHVTPDGGVLVAEHNRSQVSLRDPATGAIRWREQVVLPVSLQVLPDGGFFVASRNQLAVFDRERKRVGDVIPRQRFDVYAAQRAENGEFVLLTSGGALERLDARGVVLKSHQLPGRPIQFSGLQLLPNQRALVALTDAVTEFDLDSGKAVWTAPVANPSSVQRLPNGNTLVASLTRGRVLELGAGGRPVWEYAPQGGGRPWFASRR